MQNVLWRIQNGELDGVNPKVIVLMAGTNNVGRGDPEKNAADIATGLKAVLETCKAKAPSATVVLMGITPRNDNPTAMAVVNAANQKLAALSDGKSIRFLSINDQLADRTGKLFEGMSPDRLHLSAKGYQVWADSLKPILTDLLGPPANVDLAPPPTGDPSAKRPSK